MSKITAAGDAISSRVIDEITFQASVLALHAAIQAAGRGNQPVQALPEDTGIAQHLPEELHSLVERVRRLDPRGL
jgi:hypothetical protein